jgi:hypothetical protein
MNTDDADLQSKMFYELFDPCKSVSSVLSVVRFGCFLQSLVHKKTGRRRPAFTNQRGEKRLLLGRSHFFVQVQQWLNGHLGSRRRLKERGIGLVALDVG